MNNNKDHIKAKKAHIEAIKSRLEIEYNFCVNMKNFYDNEIENLKNDIEIKKFEDSYISNLLKFLGIGSEKSDIEKRRDRYSNERRKYIFMIMEYSKDIEKCNNEIETYNEIIKQKIDMINIL